MSDSAHLQAIRAITADLTARDHRDHRHFRIDESVVEEQTWS